AVRRVAGFDVSQRPAQIGSALGPVPAVPGLGDAVANGSRLERLAGFCLSTALKDAGLWAGRDASRVGLVLGNAAEFAWAWEEDFRARPDAMLCDPARDRRPLVPFLARSLGLTGPTLTISTAGSAGNYALSLARRWLQLGWCDVCLAGACDLGMTPLVLAGFGNLRAVS